MGIRKRKEREKERKRQEIMAAAKKVFSAKGFSKATMEEIAKEAEFSPGTLYLYFKNKDELSASLSIRILQYLNERVKSIKYDKELTSEQKFNALKEALVGAYDFDPLILTHMIHFQSSEILNDLSPEVFSKIHELVKSFLIAMAQIFEEGEQSGLFIEVHPFALAEIIWSMFSGIVLFEAGKRIIGHDKNFLRQNLDTAFDIVSQGIRKQSASKMSGDSKSAPED